MSKTSRRHVLKQAAAAWLAGSLSAEAAQEVHKELRGASARPRLFTAAEWKSLRVLCDLIIPKDEVSAGALEAGAPEFIDLLASNNKRLATLFTGGLAWLDHHAGCPFAELKPEQQTAILDQIAFRKNDSPELGPGIRFFEWARRMTVDAFYTSPVGIQDVGFKGNTAMGTFHVPAEALKYALDRSPFRS